MRRMSRREFLALSSKGLIAAELMRIFPDPEMHTVYGQNFPLATVASGTNDDTPEAILTAALDGLGGIKRFVHPGATVAIKPNATWAYPPHTASSSDPDLLRALINLVRQAGAGRIIVMDHCSIEPGTAEAIRISGISKVVKDEGVEGLFPDRTNAPLSTYIRIDLPSGKAFQKLGVIKAAVEADVRINLGLAKTHNVTKMTMTLKHMMGFLQSPGNLHAKLEQGIADLSTPSPIQAQIHILEALRVRLPLGNYRVCAGPETDITNPKVVQRRNQILAGTDPVLMDAYSCYTFFDTLPEELPYLVRAFESGVGSIDFQAAAQDGRLKMISVGSPLQAVSPATATVAPTQEKIPTLRSPALVSENAGTATPLPTATSLPEGSNQPVGINVNPDAACTESVIDPRPFLNTALIPAAGIVLGAGLVAASRLEGRKHHLDPKEKDNQNGQEE